MFFYKWFIVVDCENTFTVYSIEFLYTTLRNATLSKKCNPEDFVPIPEAIGEQEFMTDKYSFERNIECDVSIWNM